MAKKNSIQDGLQQERRLIEWMRQDLHAGFNRVVEVYQRHLQQVAYDLLRDTPRLAHLVEDVVQDGLLNSFLHLEAHPEMLQPQKNFKLKAWLTTIVHNQAIACLKTGEHHIILNAGVLGEEIEETIEEGYVTHYADPLLWFERLERIREAKRITWQLLGSLPPEQRLAVEQIYLAPVKPGAKKITYEQAAERLGKPIGTVKSQVSRALKRMREQLIDQQDVKNSQHKKIG